MTAPAFNTAVDATLSDAKAVSDERGGQYLDTWALENVVTTYLDAALRVMARDIILSKEEKRLLIVAALVDVKASRMLGPYKADSVIDAVNYMAAFASWMKAYLHHD